MEKTTKKEEKKKFNLLWIAVMVALVVTVGLITWVYFSMDDLGKESGLVDLNGFSRNEGEVQESVYAARFAYIQGDTQFLDGSAEWKVAAVDGVVSESGRIKTGKDSKAILELHDKSVIRLDEESEIVLVKLKEKEIEVLQVAGESYHRGEHGEGGTYKVVSLEAEVVPTGTAFSMETDEMEGIVKVEVIQNEVSLALSKEGSAVLNEKCLEGKYCEIDVKKGAIKDKGEISQSALLGSWYQWNKEEDEKQGAELGVLEREMTKEQEQTQAQNKETNQSGLSLTAKVGEGKVALSWTQTSLSDESFKYYKVVRSETNPNLKYPEDGYIKVISQKSTTSMSDTNISNGKKYYYRICVVNDANEVFCGNVAEVVAQGGSAQEDLSQVSVSLTASVGEGGVTLNWTKVDKSGFKYYKVVRSETNPNLKYPEDGYIKVESNKEVTSYMDGQVNLNSPGTYYYRICPVINSEVICSNVIKIVDGKVQ